MNSSNGAGKGDKPRNCFSKQFKDNFDLIKWDSPVNSSVVITKKNKKTITYSVSTPKFETSR